MIILKSIPEIIYDYFDCKYCKLMSLGCSPKRVYGGFLCSNNKLKNLKECDEFIFSELCVNNNTNLYTL